MNFDLFDWRNIEKRVYVLNRTDSIRFTRSTENAGSFCSIHAGRQGWLNEVLLTYFNSTKSLSFYLIYIDIRYLTLHAQFIFISRFISYVMTDYSCDSIHWKLSTVAYDIRQVGKATTTTTVAVAIRKHISVFWVGLWLYSICYQFIAL